MYFVLDPVLKRSPVINLKKTKASPWSILSKKVQCTCLYMYNVHCHMYTHVYTCTVYITLAMYVLRLHVQYTCTIYMYMYVSYNHMQPTVPLRLMLPSESRPATFLSPKSPRILEVHVIVYMYAWGELAPWKIFFFLHLFFAGACGSMYMWMYMNH